LLVRPEEAGHLDWQLSIDSTVTPVHQHGLNMSREVAWRQSIEPLQRLGCDPQTHKIMVGWGPVT
jgi:hypothetical protein